MKQAVESAEILILKIDFSFEGETNTIYPVVLNDPRERVLVDCGYPGFLPKVEEALRMHGLAFDQIGTVIITHHDYDHYGALAEIREKYPHIRTMASVLDAPYISGQERSLRLKQAEAIYDTLPAAEREGAMAFQRTLEAVRPAPVDITVRNGERFPWCGGAEIVATPGHMPGHISVYLSRHKTLITGDALISVHGRLRIANPHYAMDIAAAKDSVKKLLGYDIETFICYHGGLVNANLAHRLYHHLIR